jgi:integrase/DNA-binding transcriptional regulator YhcF (GntR family)
VYAGVDPLTKKRHNLIEIIPPDTPDRQKAAEKARTRLLNQVDEQRHPRTNATVNQLLDRYLDQHGGERSTLRTYHGYVDRHVRPLIGELKVGKVDADILDSLYAELRRCRDHCTDSKYIRHRTSRPHECDHRCRPHQCDPLGTSTVRQIHFILSGAFQRAVRWRWVSINPVPDALPPAAKPPQPHPPTAEEAARLVNAAWDDPDWGTFVWLTMTTGSRRGEMCGIRWRHLDLPNKLLAIQKSIGQDGKETYEKDTKTHQLRHVVLDGDTADLLTEHWQRCQARAMALGFELSRDGFVFSLSPDGMREMKPDSVTQRYGRLSARLGIDTSLHALRHYSATELIAAGVDIRTVAGRLGHGGGGATTLRVYSAWISESDQRAAGQLAARMPMRPAPRPSPVERAKTDPQSPYEQIAAEIRQQILDGSIAVGDPAPTLKQIATDHNVAAGTAHRALDLLKKWGLVDASRGRRAVVLAPPDSPPTDEPVHNPETAAAEGASRELLDLEVIHVGEVIRKVRTEADPNSAQELRQLLLDAVHRNGHGEAQIGEYEMNVRYAGERGLVTTFVTTSR